MGVPPSVPTLPPLPHHHKNRVAHCDKTKIAQEEGNTATTEFCRLVQPIVFSPAKLKVRSYACILILSKVFLRKIGGSNLARDVA
jgi:hypothetical protein